MRILALNPGSSSVKAAVRDQADTAPVYATTIERVTDIAAAVDEIAEQVSAHGTPLDAVAHRVVHGGPSHREPTVVDDQLLADLRTCVPLAPLHLPGALDSIAAARRHWPHASHVACFDTGFDRDLPEVSQRLPLPPELDALGIRRYGFHGLSVQSVLLAHHDLGDAVVAHLGSGCSITAVGADRRPRHTTMSFTPTAGIMSATRCGDIDPEIVLYLIDEHGYSTAQIRDLVNRRSGLAGVADGRHDVRDLEAAADEASTLALDMFVASTAMSIAACATTLDRWRSLVFTGGVGENDRRVRDAICARLRLDGVQTLVVVADEQRVMDLLTRDVLAVGQQ